MENKKLLIIIRYTAIIFIIAGAAAWEGDTVDIYEIILILAFIINSQIRFFMFGTNKLFVLSSILLEWVLCYTCLTIYGGMSFFFFLSSAIDSAFMLKGKTGHVLLGLTVVIFWFTSRDLKITEFASGSMGLIIIYILSAYINNEKDRKLKAQELYDKLRLSEENLKKANRDLEAYASSIEEITLLRERNRISREIHDSVGHSLSTMIIQLGAIEKTAERDAKTASAIASNLREFAKASLQEVRTAVRELKPNEYYKYEGILAVEELVKNFKKLTGINVKLSFTKEKWPLSGEQSLVIYRVIQEFLSNSLRHGKATTVNIFFSFTASELILTLKDNGEGCDDIKKGLGLTGIWERVMELGGTVEYNSKKGEGFLLKVSLKPAEDPEIF